MKMPNILMIMTDQQRADSMGYVGNKPSDTPNLDRLARQGVIFENAYSSSTSCVPARSSLMTGLLPHRVPTVDSNGRKSAGYGLSLKPGQWTIARALRDAGYETTLFGKMHFHPMHADHGFDVMHMCEHLPAGYGRKAYDDYRTWLESTGRKDHRFNQASIPKPFAYEAEYHPTSWIARHSLDFLENRDKSRPYFAVISFTAPHTPYDPPEPYASLYRPEDQELPDTGIDINNNLPDVFRRAALGSRGGKLFAPLRVSDRSENHLREVLAAIRASIKFIDDKVGEVMEKVDLDNTIVFFLSDHGDYGGNRGFLGKIPWIPFDDLARVPFFAVGAGVETGLRIREPVQSFDYLSTSLECAGVAPPDRDMDAVSLLPVLKGGSPDSNRPVFCSTTEGWPMIRRGRFKDIWHSGYDVHALFDLESDPDESVNLAGDPAYASLIAENTKILKAILAKQPVSEPDNGAAAFRKASGR
ncbi:sulfatase [Parvibaculum sp.]|uniref:sulfatase family protein n=1 Tax=Parvibaculum sp. TaxID=2024848 RepID=UPI00391BEAF0